MIGPAAAGPQTSEPPMAARLFRTFQDGYLRFAARLLHRRDEHKPDGNHEQKSNGDTSSPGHRLSASRIKVLLCRNILEGVILSEGPPRRSPVGRKKKPPIPGRLLGRQRKEALLSSSGAGAIVSHCTAPSKSGEDWILNRVIFAAIARDGPKPAFWYPGSPAGRRRGTTRPRCQSRAARNLCSAAHVRRGAAWFVSERKPWGPVVYPASGVSPCISGAFWTLERAMREESFRIERKGRRERTERGT